MDKFLYSIVVTVYNAEQFINRCIDSILKQTYVDFELILVDDGSTDKSPEICEEYERMDTRVHCVHQDNKGVFEARRIGCKMAQGEYVLFVDADDSILENMLASLSQPVSDFRCDMICSSAYFDIDSAGVWSKIQTNSLKGLYSDEKLPLLHNVFFFDCMGNEYVYPALWSKLIKRELVLAAYANARRYVKNVRMEHAEDLVISYYCLLNSNKVFILDEALYLYFHNSGSLTNRFKERMLEQLKIVLQICEDFYRTNCDILNLQARITCYGSFYLVQNVINIFQKTEKRYSRAKSIWNEIRKDDFWKKYLYNKDIVFESKLEEIIIDYLQSNKVFSLNLMMMKVFLILMWRKIK